MLMLTSTQPAYYQDAGAPAISYLSFPLTIGLGQMYLDGNTGDFYICSDNSDQSNLVWNIIPRQDQLAGILATVATTGSYTDLSNKPSIPAAQVNTDWNSVSGLSQLLNKPSLAMVATSGSYNDLSDKPLTRSQSSQSRALNSGYQISATRDSLVNYSVNISCAISLTTGQTGTVLLQIASDSGFTTNLQTVASFVNGNTGSLTLGLNLTQIVTATLTGYVPAGYYCRIATANTTGTPTFTYISGQEILM